nr:hypothetical protein [Tanacetum cinerariifolium]
MEGTPEWKHTSMLEKEDEWHAGAVKINPTEICLNKLAPSTGPVIQSTKAKNDGSLFLFDFSKTFFSSGMLPSESCLSVLWRVMMFGTLPSVLCMEGHACSSSKWFLRHHALWIVLDTSLGITSSGRKRAFC